MAIFGLQANDVLQAQINQQRQAQAVLAAAQTGSPLPSGITPPPATGGFNPLTEAFNVHQQTRPQVQQFGHQTHSGYRPQVSAHNFLQLMNFLAFQMQARLQLGQGFSNFLGGSGYRGF